MQPLLLYALSAPSSVWPADAPSSGWRDGERADSCPLPQQDKALTRDKWPLHLLTTFPIRPLPLLPQPFTLWGGDLTVDHGESLQVLVGLQLLSGTQGHTQSHRLDFPLNYVDVAGIQEEDEPAEDRKTHLHKGNQHWCMWCVLRLGLKIQFIKFYS